MCQWLCGRCGAPSYYPQSGGKHGGPERGVDPRYSRVFVGPCWRSHTYGVKCATPKGQRVEYHEGAPNPIQPDQPDAVWRTDD